MDNNDKKLKFIEAMAKHGLAHFDNGGIANFLGAGNNFQANPGTDPTQLQASYVNTQGALNKQRDFINQASNQGGFGNQSNVFAQQQALANQLQQQSNGQGPNIAQNQLNQATGQNVANQGALAAGQRGAGSNVGLIARQVGMQGANTQQQAAGQAATLQAQQQIAAQQALAQQQAQLQNTATNQISTQGGAINGYNQAALGEQNILQNANSNANNINAEVQMGNQKANTGIMGGLIGGAGAALGFLADGGTVKKMSSVHSYLNGGDVVASKGQEAVKSGDSISNDKIPAMLSEGELVIDRETMMDKGPLGQMARTLASHINKRNSNK